MSSLKKQPAQLNRKCIFAKTFLGVYIFHTFLILRKTFPQKLIFFPKGITQSSCEKRKGGIVWILPQALSHFYMK